MGRNCSSCCLKCFASNTHFVLLPVHFLRCMQVAVEVDGPTHFMANAPDVPNGSTLWRNRMLQLRSWRVVSVPVLQWSQLGSSAEKQRAYLLQRFAQAGVQLPSATSSAADMHHSTALWPAPSTCRLRTLTVCPGPW